MIPRDERIRTTLFVLLAWLAMVVTTSYAQNSRSYDTSDWIPIAKPCDDCEEGRQAAVKNKVAATARVLNLPESPGKKSFFPEEDEYRKARQAAGGDYQQYLRETTQHNQQGPPQRPKNGVDVSRAHLQQYYVTQGPLLNSKVELASQNQNAKVESASRNQPISQYDSATQQIFNAAFLQAHGNLLKQSYPNLPQQFYLQPQQFFAQPQPQLPAGNASAYNPLGLSVQTINHELVGEKAGGYDQVDITSTTSKPAKQNVQLLYVPLEQLQADQKTHQQNLNRQTPQQNFHHQQIPQQNLNRQQPQQQNFNHQQQPSIADYENSFQQHHKHQQLVDIENDFIRQALEAHRLQQQFHDHPSYTFAPVASTSPSTTSRPASRKRKPHQPPLAVYMGGHDGAEVTDVLNVLKNAKSIDVQDSVGPQSPRVFVGPAELETPSGYAKFDLPYLSSLDTNRVERKVDQLPFFVAPLNYKTPPGYSKIPLPSPHVGSVVVAQKRRQQGATDVPEDESGREEGAQNTYTREATAQNAYTTPVGRITQNLHVNEPPSTAKPPGHNEAPHYYIRRPSNRSKGRQQHRNRAQADVAPSSLNLPNEDVLQATTRTPEAVYDQPPPVLTSTAPPEHQLRLHLPNLYAATASTPPPPTPQIRHKQQTSPNDFFSSSGFDSFSSTPSSGVASQREVVRNFYAALDDVGSTPSPGVNHVQSSPTYQNAYLLQGRDKQPQRGANIEDLFSIIPPPPPSTGDRANNNPSIFDDHISAFPQVDGSFAQEDGASFPQGDYRKFEQLFRPVYLTDQAENTYVSEAAASSTSSTTTERASPSTRDKYTVLEEFSVNQAGTTPSPQSKSPATEAEDVYVSTAQSNRATNTEEAHQVVAPSHVTRGRNQQRHQTHKSNAAYTTTTKAKADEFEGLQTHKSNAAASPTKAKADEVVEDLPQISPFLPGLINELQDQSIRQLLAPVLLAPTSTTEKGFKSPPVGLGDRLNEKLVRVTPDYAFTNPITANVVRQEATDYDYTYPSLTPTTVSVETTTERKQQQQQRGRGRGGSRFNARARTTSTPRRTRTQHPSRTRSRGQDTTTTTYSPRTNSFTTEASRRSPTRQRSKTRGRPVKNEDASTSISEKVNTYTPPEVTTIKEGDLPQPNSYFEFEQPVQKPQLITKSKILTPEEEYLVKKYNLAYSVADDGRRLPDVADNHPQQGQPDLKTVSLQLTHPITEISAGRPQVYVERGEAHVVSTTGPTRIRGRFRGKSKVAATTSTTTTTTATVTQPKSKMEAEEFYGFFRQPSYASENQVEVTTHAPYREPVYSPSYVSSSSVQPPSNRVESEEKIAGVQIYTSDARAEPPATVRFVGEIRPKYQHQTTLDAATTTAKYYITTSTRPTTATPRRRIRGRIRVPTKKGAGKDNELETTSQRSSYVDETRTEETSTQRRRPTRGRVGSHFQLPDRLKQEATDEDVEGGNYPQQLARASTEPPPLTQPTFQITIDPSYDEEEDDQVPHSSIYRPKVLPPLDAADFAGPNDIQVEAKGNRSTDKEGGVNLVAAAEEDLEETVAAELQATTTTTTTTTSSSPGASKRGYWKLVGQKAVDVFEGAESQNVGVVSANSAFDADESKEYKKRNKWEAEAALSESNTEEAVATVTTPDFFDSIYEMFGLATAKPENATVVETKPENASAIAVAVNAETDGELAQPTTNATPPLPEELTETAATTEVDVDEGRTDLTVHEAKGTLEDVMPWDLGVVRTSTSTEISHETEICYKGVCVKSKGVK